MHVNDEGRIEHIREAAIYSLEKGRTYYTSNLGTIELRREISKYVGRNFGLEYDPQAEVIVTVGVSEALDIALRAVLNPGDKVLYQDPCFVSYHPTVLLAHGVGLPIKTTAESAFTLKAEEVERSWEPGCKVLLINSTSAPGRGRLPCRATTKRPTSRSFSKPPMMRPDPQPFATTAANGDGSSSENASNSTLSK